MISVLKKNKAVKRLGNTEAGGYHCLRNLMR